MKTIGAMYGLLIALSGSAIAQQTTPTYGHHYMWGGWYGWFMGPIMMLVFIALAAVIVILLVRWLGGSGHGPAIQSHGPPGKSPLDILKERFAKGEIDKDEFEERRRVLGE